MNLDEIDASQLPLGDHVDAIVDVHGHSLCTCCLEGMLPDTYSAGSAKEGTPGRWPRAWWFERKLTSEEKAALRSYFEKPACTPERHAVFEKRCLREMAEGVAAARSHLAELEAGYEHHRKLAPGWSIK